MKILFAPWRMKFIRLKKEGRIPKGCFICRLRDDSRDRDNFVVYRGKHAFVFLNRYPYAPGHLLIAPYRHVVWPEELTSEERKELMDLVARAVEVVKKAVDAKGVNVGMNLGGEVAGGSCLHLHVHVLPRWPGDVGFPILSDTVVIVQALEETYREIKKYWGD